jgi:succinate dehydrogenase / fumarate reductase, cytochrome b subunit
LTSLVLTLTETLRYRGGIGQWSWVLHRITGLGVVLFLTLHVIDTSWAVFYPELYVKAIAVYQTPLFTLGEFGLVACVVYHAYNGMRIAIFDARPEMWKHQSRAAWIVLGLTVVTLIPTFALMFGHVVEFYGEGRPVLGLAEVLSEQVPFAVGMLVALIAAIVVSAVLTPVLGVRKGTKGRPSGIDKFWWSFMRLSGLLILPLVFGHLAMAHVLQGVFDITVANYTVIGVPTNPSLPALMDGINQSGTSVEYVAERWNFLLAGVAVWRIYDIALLLLTALHGFNGLRYVLTDHTMGSPFLRRAMVYLCVIGGVVLIVVGGLALLGTIDQSAVDMATAAAERLHGG